MLEKDGYENLSLLSIWQRSKFNDAGCRKTIGITRVREKIEIAVLINRNSE